MHFCVLAARVGRPGMTPGHLSTSGACWPRKIGLNWFIPALANISVGSSRGTHGLEGTKLCPRRRTK